MKIFTYLLTLLFISTACFAQYRDENKAMKYSNTYHVNVFLNIGGGFDQINTGIETTTGELVTISAGGGAGIGLQLGYTMPSPSLDFSFSAMAQLSVLNPPLENIDGMFSRIIFEPMVKYIFEIKKIKSSINGGLGIDFATNGKMDVDASQLTFGAHNIFSYKNAVGPAILIEYQFRIKKISLSAGLKYYSLTYDLESATTNGAAVQLQYIPADILKDVKELDGSGIDFNIGFGFYF